MSDSINDLTEDNAQVIADFFQMLTPKMSEHTKGIIDRYVNHGYPPGSFVYCVLTNNLVGAFRCADAHNSASMRDIVSYVYNNIPSTCWGSEQIVHRWVSHFVNGVWVDEPETKIDDDCEHQ